MGKTASIKEVFCIHLVNKKFDRIYLKRLCGKFMGWYSPTVLRVDYCVIQSQSFEPRLKKHTNK